MIVFCIIYFLNIFFLTYFFFFFFFNDTATTEIYTLSLHDALLDLHAPAATVAQLTPRHVGVQILRRELEAGRKSLDHGREAGSVRFPCGGEANASHAVNLQAACEPAFRGL